MRGKVLTHRHRPQRDHNILLRLCPPHHCVSCYRLRRCAAWQWSLSLLCRRSMRPRICNFHLAHDQRLRRFPAIRRRHNSISVAAAGLQYRDVSDQLRCVTSDVQGMGRTWAREHCRLVRGGLPVQRAVLGGVRCDAADSGTRNATRTMAALAHLLWRVCVRSCADRFVCVQRNDLRQCRTLHGRAVLCDAAEPASGHDGVQGKSQNTDLRRKKHTANTLHSIGTPSRRRTSNSPLARGRTTGKSRTCSRKTTKGTRCTTTATSGAASTHTRATVHPHTAGTNMLAFEPVIWKRVHLAGSALSEAIWSSQFTLRLAIVSHVIL